MENTTALVDDEAVRTPEQWAADDAAYAERVPEKANVIWAFVAACEAVAAGGQALTDCDTCRGAGCGRCAGLGFRAPADWVKAVLVAVEAAGFLGCTDDGHAVGCGCGGELLAATA